MKLAIGFVHPDMVSAFFMQSLLRAKESIDFQHIGVHSGPRIDLARNEVVEHFLKTDCDRLLFVDSDIIFGPSHVERLCKSDEAIISGLYFIGSVYAAHPLLVYSDGRKRPTDWPRGGTIDVDAVGCGFLLIKREVFETVPAPWFKWGENGEDVYFCDQARAAGYSVKCDTSVTLGHMKMKAITFLDHDGVPSNRQSRMNDLFPR